MNSKLDLVFSFTDDYNNVLKTVRQNGYHLTYTSVNLLMEEVKLLLDNNNLLRATRDYKKDNIRYIFKTNTTTDIYNNNHLKSVIIKIPNKYKEKYAKEITFLDNCIENNIKLKNEKSLKFIIDIGLGVSVLATGIKLGTWATYKDSIGVDKLTGSIEVDSNNHLTNYLKWDDEIVSGQYPKQYEKQKVNVM